MSIRYKILLPLLGFLAMAGLLSGVTGLVGLAALGDLSTVADHTSEANEASRAARDRFRRAEELVARVTTMTDLLDMASIHTEFAEASGELTRLLDRLKVLALSERMRASVQAAADEAGRWRIDAEILLGIRPASEIPTQDRMVRHSRDLQKHFDAAVALAAVDGRAQIAATSAATTWKIWLSLGLVGGVVMLGSGTAWWLAASLSRPLVRLTADTTRLARGDTGVQLLAAGRVDEIGDIARGIVAIRDMTLADAARQIEKTAADRLREEHLRRKMLRDLADRFERSIGTIVTGVGQAVGSLQASSGTMRVAVTGTARRSGSAADAARQTRDDVDAVAVSANAIDGTVTAIGRHVEQATGMSAFAVQTAARTRDTVAMLDAAAARIGNIVGIVSTIARQTNLLALNATIEAARAGASGRGFAVVAVEVKQLALQTSHATAEIDQQVSAIQAATGEAAQAIEDIAEQIHAMSGVTTSIAAAVQDQTAATQEIMRSMSQARLGTGQMTADIAEVAEAASGAGGAAEAVAVAADAMAAQSDCLRTEVEQFLTSVRAA